MVRSFSSLTIALTTGTAILLGGWAVPVSAQPAAPASPAPAASPKKTYPEVEKALKTLIQQRNIAGAIKELEEASRHYSELPSAHVMMFQFLGQLKEPAAAKLQLEVAVNKTPSDPEPWVILGNIALQERRVAEATNDFEKAKQLLETYPNADRKSGLMQQTLSGTAQVAEAKEKWSDAETRLRELLKLDPENLAVHERLAHVLFRQEDKSGAQKEAYELLKQAKEIDKKNAAKNKTLSRFLTPEAMIGRYIDQMESGKANPSGKAEEWFTAALRLAPEDLQTRQVVGIWALERGKLEIAKKQADAAQDIEKKDPKTYAHSFIGRMLGGLVALWEKEWGKAEENFQSVIIELPNDFVARNNLALALAEQDDPVKKKRALDYANTNYKDNQNSPDALSTLAWVNFRNGNLDAARLAIEGAIKAMGGNLNNPDTATYWAYILHSSNSQQDWQAKEILKAFLDSGRPFSMKKEAQDLFEKVKDAKKPADAAGTTPTLPASK
jgi:tetratricopeptide (TPR) repeat protein